MTTYRIEEGRACYAQAVDTLYLGYGNSSLDHCCALEDTPSGITVTYDSNGSFSGAEVFDVVEKFGRIPERILVDAKSPFEIVLPEAAWF